MGSPGGSDNKESACNTGDLGSHLGSGRSYSPRGRRESDTTEWASLALFEDVILPLSAYLLRRWVKTCSILVNKHLLRNDSPLDNKAHQQIQI